MVDSNSYFLFLICLISTILIWAFFKSNRAKSHLPPSPFSLPIIGHLHLLAPAPHRAFHKLSLSLGPVFRVLLGSKPCVIVCSPETAKEFLKTHEYAFSDRPHNSVLAYITYGSQDFAFASYGPYWRFVKKILVSQLLNATSLDSLLFVRQDEINRLINLLSQNAKVGSSVDLSKEIVKLTNNVISRMLMSERCSENESEAVEVRKLVGEITEMIGKFNISEYIWLFKNLDLQGFGKRLKDLRTRYDVLIERIIKEHEDARKHGKAGMKDLLNVLLDVKEDESMEIKLTKENIKALILNIFIGATETSAITLEWVFSELINHPNIMKKLVEEIDQVVGKNRLLQESDIPSLPYLQAVVKESLRLHPPSPLIPRQCTQDCKVAGYDIPANSTVFISMWDVSRDPNYWENPLEFQPERFMDSQVDVRGQHFQVLPFGSGRRMCTGTSLALHVVQTTVGVLIQCFEWKAGKDGNLSRVDMEEAHKLTLPRANPLVCVPVARLHPMPTYM